MNKNDVLLSEYDSQATSSLVAPYLGHAIPCQRWRCHQPAEEAWTLRSGDDEPVRALRIGSDGGDPGAGCAIGQVGHQADAGTTSKTVAVAMS